MRSLAAVALLTCATACAQRDPEVDRVLSQLRAEPQHAARHLAALAARPEAAGPWLSEVVKAAPHDTTEELATLAAALVELAPYERPPSNLGTDVTPLFQAALRRRDGPAQHLLVTAMRRLSSAREVSATAPVDELVRHLADTDGFKVGVAARVLVRRKEDARAALPQLLEAFDARARVGPAGPLRVFVARVGSAPVGDATLTAVSLARAIAAVVPGDVRCVLPHAVLLLHGTAAEQLSSVHALARAGDDARAAIPQLTIALRSEDAAVAQEAATALGAVGPAARGAIGELERLAQGENRQLAGRARAALRAIRGE